MAELMDERADTVGAVVYPLVGACIMLGLDTVVDMSRRATAREIPAVGPHRVGACPSGLAATGVEHEYIVDISVAVAVILREVDLRVKDVEGVHHHHLGVGVVVKHIVASVVVAVARQRHGAVDIELRTEGAGGIEAEILRRASCGAIVGESLLVEHAVEIVVWIVEGEFHVGVFHYHNKSLLVTVGREGIASFSREETVALLVGRAVGSVGLFTRRETTWSDSRLRRERLAGTCRHARLEACLVYSGEECFLGSPARGKRHGTQPRLHEVAPGCDVAIVEEAVFLNERETVFGEILMEALVASDGDAQSGAVAQRHLEHSPFRRDGPGRRDGSQCRRQGKKPGKVSVHSG